MKIEIKRNEKSIKEPELGIKEVLKTLSLFFALCVISIMMLSSKFQKGVENFWQDKEGIEKAVGVVIDSEIFRY